METLLAISIACIGRTKLQMDNRQTDRRTGNDIQWTWTNYIS